MRPKYHNLSGQNLIRHNIINELVNRYQFYLISDTCSIYKLIFITLTFKQNYICHALELYTISYNACFYEYFFIFKNKNINKLRKFKSFIGFFKALLKVFLLKIITSRSKVIIVSSHARKVFLNDEALPAKIIILKNKPLYTDFEKIFSINTRSNNIVSIGNIYGNKSDFIKAHLWAIKNNIKIICYGIGEFDKRWILNENFSNVILHDSVDHKLIPEILLKYKFSLCIYGNKSLNQKYSASSKIYEILYYGSIPLISDNLGLKSELSELGANYYMIDDLSEVVFNHQNSVSLFNNDFSFENEIFNFSKEFDVFFNCKFY